MGSFMFLLVAAAGGAKPSGGMLEMFMPMIIIIAIFYFMLIRPQQRKEKERRQMIDNIKAGEKVVFSGGIMGTVTNAKATTFVIKIADNVKIEVARGAVNRVLEKGEKVEKDEASGQE